ncbi:iron-sulfur cluster biosynthesis family protein [uncultured Lactobacillus sp.]|uniref:iron-sulfur cluster biosynthesis family protein n=1 Tax=uncultured Lactobacillus sp. TaxID=153152 RepID=UPI0026138AE1|nr:iron-sulfur cluster biosynthesis family protein [uncultured Lactobacillus sp.]
MIKMIISQEAIDFLINRGYNKHEILLIVDGGGGDYSIEGGSCNIGMDYSLISLDTMKHDPRYSVKIENNANFEIYTSDYDLAFLGNNLILDVHDTTLRLRNDSGILTGAVKIAKASFLAERAKEGITDQKNC